MKAFKGWVTTALAGLVGYEVWDHWFRKGNAPAQVKNVVQSVKNAAAGAASANAPLPAATVSATTGAASVPVPLGTSPVPPTAEGPSHVAVAASLAAHAVEQLGATNPSARQIVRDFQEAAGFKGADIDGKYGPNTRAAVARYVTNPPPAPAIYGGTG